jgi:hypothetical protein
MKVRSKRQRVSFFFFFFPFFFARRVAWLSAAGEGVASAAISAQRVGCVRTAVAHRTAAQPADAPHCTARARRLGSLRRISHAAVGAMEMEAVLPDPDPQQFEVRTKSVRQLADDEDDSRMMWLTHRCCCCCAGALHAP